MTGLNKIFLLFCIVSWAALIGVLFLSGPHKNGQKEIDKHVGINITAPSQDTDWEVSLPESIVIFNEINDSLG